MKDGQDTIFVTTRTPWVELEERVNQVPPGERLIVRGKGPKPQRMLRRLAERPDVTLLANVPSLPDDRTAVVNWDGESVGFYVPS